MLSSVLRSKRAVAVNIEIMRAFVRLRRMLASNEELARKLAVLEKKYDAEFKVVFNAIRELMKPPGAEQTEDWVSGLGKSRALRKSITRHFDVSGIPETSKHAASHQLSFPIEFFRSSSSWRD